LSKPEKEFHLPAGEWRPSGLGNSGIWDQMLAQDPGSGDATLLQRYEAGAATPPETITHEYWEEVMILSGELTDLGLGRTFTAGMYACRPPGMKHGPYRSEPGCSMLVFIRYASETAS
jgi:hypothetical protein